MEKEKKQTLFTYKYPINIWLNEMPAWDDEILFQTEAGMNAINVKTGTQRFIVKTDKLAAYERAEWSEQVMCYAIKQEASPTSYANSSISVYDIQTNKRYRYNPEEDFLLYSLCDNGCLINLTGDNGRLVEMKCA